MKYQSKLCISLAYSYICSLNYSYMYNMNWNRLISAKRLGMEAHHRVGGDDRSEFLRDYDRLVFSAPFRRLQNKTQVFPLPGSVFVHNRLTHSLEVSCVGRSLGNRVSRMLIDKHPELRGTAIEEIGNIVSAACLAHDLGNPPFGHSGERWLMIWATLPSDIRVSVPYRPISLRGREWSCVRSFLIRNGTTSCTMKVMPMRFAYSHTSLTDAVRVALL